MDLCAIWDICARMDAHEGQAAWAQAVGSVVAIAASGFFAIWVPLHIRDLEHRGVVERALVSLSQVVGVTHSAWETLKEILQAKQFHGLTTAALRERVSTARATADQIAPSLLHQKAFEIVTVCRMRLQTLEFALVGLDESRDPYAFASDIPFHDILKELDEISESVVQIEPKRIGQYWMACSPDDDKA